MDEKESAFFAKLLATFKLEADDHLNNLSNGLVALESNPSEEAKKELLETVFREAHSLKGASRAVNLISIEKLCQALENVLSASKKGRLVLSRSAFDLLYSTLDLIGKWIRQEQPQTAETLNEFVEKLNSLEKEEPVSSISEADISQKKEIPSPAPSEPIHKETDASNQIASKTSSIDHTASENYTDKSIRISLSKLDKLLQQSEEMLYFKYMAARRAFYLHATQDFINQWKKKWFIIQSDANRLLDDPPLQGLKDFLTWQQDAMKNFEDSINHRSQEATQTYYNVSLMVDTLLNDIKNTLMQPFSTLFEVLPRMIRDISRQLNKDVNLQLKGEDVEIDRRILEELKDPLIHVIRNSIDHGIEKSEERVKSHKPLQGTIRVEVSQASGNNVEILISDDGQGINTEKVKQVAIKQGIISEQEANQLSDQELLRLIFHSGISTSPLVTELSGRGLGLVITQEKVEKLGGQIHVETKKNQGTTFKIILPLTLATFRGIHIKAAGREFIIPVHYITRILRIKSDEIQLVENKEIVNVNEIPISFILLSDLLDLPRLAINPVLFAILIKTTENTIAIGVDEVLNEQEILIKSLGRQLIHIQNIAGATISESGQVIPILNPLDLVRLALKSTLKKHPLESSEKEHPIEKRSILIAEDSMTSRILLKNILESAGYVVKTAVDGSEAFTLLKTEPFDLLLTDIEMPKMTGLELIQKIRQIKELQELPVIVCSTRDSQEDREQGIEVGANAYISKTNFTHSDLIDIIQKLL